MARSLKKILQLILILFVSLLLITYFSRVWLVNKLANHFAPESMSIDIGGVDLGFIELSVSDISVKSPEIGQIFIGNIDIKDLSNISLSSVVIHNISLNKLSYQKDKDIKVSLEELQFNNLMLSESKVSLGNMVLRQIEADSTNENKQLSTSLALLELNKLVIIFQENQSLPEMIFDQLTLVGAVVRQPTQADLSVKTIKLAAFKLSKNRANLKQLHIESLIVNYELDQLTAEVAQITLDDLQAIHQELVVSAINWSNLVVEKVHTQFVDKTAGNTIVNLQTLNIAATELRLIPDITVDIKAFNLHMLDVKTINEEQLITLESLSLYEIKHQSDLTKIDFIDFLNIYYTSASKAGQADAALPYFLNMPRLSLSNMMYTPELFKLDTIDIKGGAVKLTRSEQGVLNILPVLPEPNDNDDIKQVINKEQNTPNEPLEATNANEVVAHQNFAIAHIKLDPEFVIIFNDETVKTSSIKLIIKSMIVEDIDTEVSANPAEVSLIISLDDSADISANGFFHPANNGDFDIHSQFKHLELITISPYVESYTGYSIDAGQMDLKLDVSAKKSQLNGQTDVIIRKIDLNAVDQDLAGNLTQQLSMPLPTALSILKNNKGDIELKIPVAGDMNDPNFGLGSIINLLTMKALKVVTFSYLKNALFPGGILIDVASLAAGSIYNKLTAFPPITFQKGLSSVDQINNDILLNIAALMNDKNNLTLKICPVVAIDEHDTEAGRISIANARSNSVREILQKQGIASERLMRCKEKIDEKQYSLVYLLIN